MSAKSLELRLRRGTRFMESLVGPIDWSQKKVFGFHRHRDWHQPKGESPRRYTWDVWLWLGRNGLNLSCHRVAPELRSLDEARGWALDFAKEHGFEALERKRKEKRPALRVVQGGAP